MAQRNRFSRRSLFISIGIAVLAVSAGIFLIYSLRKPAVPLANLPATPQSSNPAESGGSIPTEGEQAQLSISLSQGQVQVQAATPLPLATGEALTAGEIEQVLSRLPALIPTPGEQQDFQLPQQPIPPPRPGQTIQESFPPPPNAIRPETVEPGPLKVLRFAPEGEIPIAPFISVTFNQPMVPLDTLAQLSAGQVPVKMEPALPGTWRWLGTKTLTFEYDSTLIDRLPKATVYRVSVPAGTKSASGGVLAEAVESTFSTPPVTVTNAYPQTNEPQPLQPLFFIHFDQRVDPAAVLSTIQVTSGNQRASLKLLDEAEVKADEQGKLYLKQALEGRWLAFRVLEPLPADSDITVTVGPGAPSAEGPLLSKTAYSYRFHTYAPLKVLESGCNWGSGPCEPLAPFYIRFNNPIDASTFNDSLVSIKPELPGALINLMGDSIQIQGASKGQTTYTVTLSAQIQDTFGQKLGKDTSLEFKVGRAQSILMGPGKSFITLDPFIKKPVFSVYAINYARLDLKVYAVQPSDWPAFQKYLQDYQRTDVPLNIPGRQVISRTIKVENAADTLSEVDIDLSEVMDGPFGQFIIIVKPPRDLLKDPQNQYWQTVQAWVQATQIGLDAYADYSDLVTWATALKDGAPLAQVDITAQPGGQQIVTNKDGTGRITIPDGTTYLVAKRGADQALLPRSEYSYGNDGWYRRVMQDELRWYVLDDRQMYRPGEEVHIKGWLRRIGSKQDGDVSLVTDMVSAVRYQVLDPQGNNLGGGQAKVNGLGGFDFAFTLPKATNLGYASLNLTAEGNISNLSGTQFGHGFQIQEFRRPEFEVSARNETPGPYFAGEQASVAVEAKYYAGGPLPGADVTWQVYSTPGHYAPPKWPDFTFGTWTPWWSSGNVDKGGYFGPGGYGESKVETFTGKTDDNGTHYLRLDFSESGKPEPVSVTAEATVMDVNRQAWTNSTKLLVHPASLYVGLRSDRLFVDRGTPIKVDLIVTDLDGNPVTDRPIDVRAARLEWKNRNGRWSEEEVDIQNCKQGSGLKPVTCTFETPLGGTYRITANVTDSQGRKNESQLTRWVSGGKTRPEREVTQEQVTLIPDKENYQPGDTAQILVQSPFSPAEGLLTVNRSGIIKTERFHIEDGSITLKVPVEEKYTPNINIQVDLNGAFARTDDQGNAIPDAPDRPAFATGQLTLKIPPVTRKLDLQVTPQKPELEPGGNTVLDLLLKDAGGQPVSNAELSVIVVDEAILALTNYDLADPIATFYTERPLDLYSVYTRSSIILANPQVFTRGAQNKPALSKATDLAGGVARNMMEAPAAALPAATQAPAMQPQGARQTEPIRVRSDFNPLAAFAPSVLTDANGMAKVEVKLPDNLTRYRVMVLAADASRKFGSAESNLTARLPLMVRPSAPRFLNFGDRFELPVVVQNQTGEEMVADVAIRTSNLKLTGPAGLRVTIPARNRVEVRFPAEADMAGTARFQVAAVAGTAADAATIELPVYTPATTEAFATYGVIDEGAVAQPVAALEGVFPQFGGLEITTSSTALQALTDAVFYLVSYPYDFTEQLSSRILAIASLRDVLTSFKAEGLPSPAKLESFVQKDLQALKGLQNSDGGFPTWRRGQVSSPFITIHTAHALYRAELKGFTVPTGMKQPVLEYLRQIESHYPAWYSQSTRRTLSSYALYVRNLMGDRDPDKALKLYKDAGLDGLSLDAIGWLWPVIEDVPGTNAQLEEIRRYIANRTVETAGAANFTTQYDDQNYLLLGSDRRTDAILLDALMNDNPQNDLIPKLVNGLLAQRTKGRWGSTQENVFVLLALDRYFNTFEAQTPDFVASIWLGNTYAGSQEFRGRSTDLHETSIPMTYLVDPALGGGRTQDLLLSKDGAGRLYYRLGLRYAPSDLQLGSLNMGFVVSRSYEGLDDPKDVSQDKDGTWHVRAGARVRVKLTMVADNRRYHVALVDPLPAGLEIVNPELAVSAEVPQNPASTDFGNRWWWGPWYEHQNMRDERAEAFTTLLWEGVYQYSYIARATTPGRFVVPPAKAEEMYSPEVFGRSASDLVVVGTGQ